MPHSELFSVSADELDGRCVLRPVGELDVAAVPEMQARMSKLLEGCPDLEIDLGEVTFLDSSGLRLLLDAKQRCSQAEGRLTLSNASDDVLRVIDLTGLTPVLL